MPLNDVILLYNEFIIFMLYRKFGQTYEEISILGFGCMIFPTVDEGTKKLMKKNL